MYESQKTGPEGALINSSETTDPVVSRPSVDRDTGSTLAEDKCLAPNLTKTLFAFVLITEGI